VDYINAGTDVPGSKEVTGLVRRGQVRQFSRPLKNTAPIQKITIESYNNQVSPAFVAITAETGSAASPASANPANPASSGVIGKPAGEAKPGAQSKTTAEPSSKSSATFTWGSGIKAFLLGGGASHDYPRWFGRADTATLEQGGLASANYTEEVDLVATVAKDVDVLVISNNKPYKDPAARKAIFDHANAGKGIVLLHAGLWRNWADWPEFNQELCGGSSRGHDRFGEYEVKLTSTKHPVTADVPESFKITDECYWFDADPKGTPIEVLATGFSAQKNKDYPMVFVVKHPKARIVGITLGHDGKAHDLDAFKTLLRNSVKWVAKQ
jgi:type 1 glutamine amidotransferase